MEHPHDPRYCRTHAFVAQLYAAAATQIGAIDTWNYLARSWAELADIKSRAAEMDRQTHRLKSGMTSGMTRDRRGR